ncbi:MAG TPA: hypothetical protein VLI04_12590 [Nocardioidaceae bacterium]|nr:hypothetical protein [Nocardioidaceae bacterium]
MKPTYAFPLLLTAALAMPTPAAPLNTTSWETSPVIRVKDARIKFEMNATDKDGGVQVFFDADDWLRMSLYDPSGRRIYTSETKGRMARQGGTELFLESAEPPFSEVPLRRLLHRWPEGRYAFRGMTTDGVRLVGSAVLTHAIARGPKLLGPP